MKHIAKALAAQGRGPDTELLHVTKPELAALNQIARSSGLGSLTTNPTTGLPEASLLGTILPIVGAVVGTFAGGQTALGAEAGGAIGGALGGYAGSRVNNTNPYLGTILGGVGGYAAGASGLGAPSAPAATGATGASLAGEQAAAQGAGAAATPAATGIQTLPAATTPVAGVAAAPSATPLTGQIAEGYFGGQAAAPLTGQIAAGYAPQAATSASPALVNWVAKNPLQAYMLGAGAYRAVAGPQQVQQQKRPVYMAGVSRPGIMQTGLVPEYGGPEQQYFSGNQLYNYTQDPGYTVQRYADGGAVAPKYSMDQVTAPTQAPAATTPRYGLGSLTTPEFTAANAPAPQAAFTYTQPQASPSTADWYARAATAEIPGGNTPWMTPAPSGGDITAQQVAALGGNLGTSYAPGPAVDYTSQIADLQRQQAALAAPAMTSPTQADWYFQAARSAPSYQAQQQAALQTQLDQLKQQQQLQQQQEIADRARRGMQGYAKGGILNLRPQRKSMDPMFIRGAGDGMTDSVPAKIDGDGHHPDEPIRVADGEYIVPADAVAHLGNGSSNAGSKKLDAMVSRVRKARTGKTQQAPEIKAERKMPA